MGRARAEVEGQSSSFDLAGQAEDLTARFKGGLSRIARGASKRVKGAAQDLRSSPILQHAIAARDRGNLEAAFWLLNEEFEKQPEFEVALHYWDVALALGRVDIAAQAGAALVESQAAAGAPELAAQHWLELVKEAPDVLVSPAAIATMLPALKQRLSEASQDGAEEPETLAGYLRRAVRHAVDPRNTGLHPGVALRLFEEGRDLNPEAARRAAEAALESPHLHEAKRERLQAWLAGKPLETKAPPPRETPAPAAASGESAGAKAGLSGEEIERAAARLPRAKSPKPAPQPPASEARAEAAPNPAPELEDPPPEDLEIDALDDELETDDPSDCDDLSIDELEAEEACESGEAVDADAAEPADLEQSREPEASEELEEVPEAPPGPRIRPARLAELADEGLRMHDDESVAWDEIEAVSVAEVMGLEDAAVAVVDLVLNWTQRGSEDLEIVRLRVSELDLDHLVTRKHALGSDFAAFMGDVMERTRAIPLPDPESALGTRITCFETPELYEREGLRIPA